MRSCTIENGGCGPHATCSHHANTNAVKCTDKADFTTTGSASGDISLVNIPANAKWSQNGVTVAGGNGAGVATNQLYWPWSLSVDDDQTMFISEHGNSRIMEWKSGATNGQVVTSGTSTINTLNTIDVPSDILIDKETDSLIICDKGNQRVVQWSRRSGTTEGKLLVDNIDCWGLAMDKQRNLYVGDGGKTELRRYRLGEKNSTLIAGNNGVDLGLDQLTAVSSLSVDQHRSVYISQFWSDRVIKWVEGAKEGIVVAGGQGTGSSLAQLDKPLGIFVDALGTLYIADMFNHRIMRWTQGAKVGTVIAGGNGVGAEANQFFTPYGLTFDRQGNLYVADTRNNRIQRFSIEKD
ncbi:unnamed protein product [Rotaria socialis]